MSNTERAKDTQSNGAVFQQSALQTQILLLLYDGWLVSDFSLFWDYQFSVVKRERERKREIRLFGLQTSHIVETEAKSVASHEKDN